MRVSVRLEECPNIKEEEFQVPQENLVPTLAAEQDGCVRHLPDSTEQLVLCENTESSKGFVVLFDGGYKILDHIVRSEDDLNVWHARGRQSINELFFTVLLPLRNDRVCLDIAIGQFLARDCDSR